MQMKRQRLDTGLAISSQSKIPDKLKLTLIEIIRDQKFQVTPQNSELINKLFENLKIQTKRFNKYMQAYTHQKDQLGFWSRNFYHTNNGIKHAEKYIKHLDDFKNNMEMGEWDKFHQKPENNLEKVLSKEIEMLLLPDKNLSEKTLIEAYINTLKKLNDHAIFFLKGYHGNYRKHSAKTYIMSYIKENKQIINYCLASNIGALHNIELACPRWLCNTTAMSKYSDSERENYEKKLKYNNMKFKNRVEESQKNKANDSKNKGCF